MEGVLSEQNSIWQILLAVHRAKLTGTLMLTTDNQLIQIQWQTGELIAVTWRAVKGKAALERLLQVKTGQYRFMDNILRAVPQLDLPNIRDLLATASSYTKRAGAETVSGGSSQSGTVAAGSAVTGTLVSPPPPLTPAPALLPTVNFDLNRQTLQQIYGVLTDDVGKRAAEIMIEVAEQQGLGEAFRTGTIPRAKAREWIVQVAQHIRDPLNRTAFIRRATTIAEL